MRVEIKDKDKFITFLLKVKRLDNMSKRGPLLRFDLYNHFTVEELGWFLDFIKVSFIDSWWYGYERLCTTLRIYNPYHGIDLHTQINSPYLGKGPLNFYIGDNLVDVVDDVFFRRHVLGETSDE